MLKLKNTWSKALETVELPGGKAQPVLMYTCGPTVYSFAHIGNFRSFLLGDVLRRTLEHLGYRVRQVMNITDVGHMTQDHLADATGEDKLSKAARELGGTRIRWLPTMSARSSRTPRRSGWASIKARMLKIASSTHGRRPTSPRCWS